MIISIEGLDRSGKTTLINTLKALIAKTNQAHQFVFTKETNISANPVADPLLYQQSQFLLNPKFSHHDNQLEPTYVISPLHRNLLFASLRAHNYYQVIKPALDANQNVIIDRQIHSSFAYALNDVMMQKYWNREIANGRFANKAAIIEQLLNLYLLSANHYIPDLVFYLDVPLAILEQRRYQQKTSWSQPQLNQDAIEAQYDQDQIHWQAVANEYQACFDYVQTPYGKKSTVVKLDGLLSPQQLANQVFQTINQYSKSQQLDFKIR